MEFTLNLSAGVPQRPQSAGGLFVLVSTGVAASIGVKLWRGAYPLEEIATATRGFRAKVADGGRFDSVELVSNVDTQVRVVVSDGAIDFDFTDGASVTVLNGPVPLLVSNDRGSPGNPVNVTAVTVADAPAVSVNNGAGVACSSVAAVVATANAARRELRFANLGADPVAIGAAGITWAARCIVLNPGDVWIETRAANLAWSAICDAAKTATVTKQEVIT